MLKTSAALSSRASTVAGVQSSIGGLPAIGALAIEFVAQLADEFTLGPGEPGVVDRHRKQTLVMPAVLLDLLRIAACAAITSGVPPHATPPLVSMDHSRMAIASASLLSAGEKPLALTAAIMASFGAFPLPVACRLMVPTGTP